MTESEKDISNNIATYRLWFEFLKLSDPSKWSAEVTRDFGDVMNTDFETWWKDHSYLFKQVDPFDIVVIEDEENYKHFADDEDPDLLIVAINLLEPKINLEKKFEQLLKKYHKAPKGRPKFEDLAEHHSLYALPSNASLTAVLNVYKDHLKNPDKPLEKIEEDANLITKKGSGARSLWLDPDYPVILAERKRIQVEEVKRHLKRARNLIRNVEQGIFPKDD